MADTTPVVDPVTPEALKNEVTPVATPVVNAPDPAEFERLQKEQEKKDLRIRQLENEAAKRLEAEEAAKSKELEEKEQYKTLYEQEKAKREEIERGTEAAEHKAELEKSKTSILSDYSDDVKALAEDTGLSLSDVTEEAVADFKAKLDKIQTRVGAAKVTPNNPGTPSGQQEYSREEMYVILNDPVKRDEYYRKKDGVTAMMMQPPKA